jgi:hypothetical protein
MVGDSAPEALSGALLRPRCCDVSGMITRANNLITIGDCKFLLQREWSVAVDSLSSPVIGLGTMSTVDDLRAKANHYRTLSKHVTDPRSLEAMEQLASELDDKADALEKEGGPPPAH